LPVREVGRFDYFTKYLRGDEKDKKHEIDLVGF
jgi:hypothetical protein